MRVKCFHTNLCPIACLMSYALCQLCPRDIKCRALLGSSALPETRRSKFLERDLARWLTCSVGITMSAQGNKRLMSTSLLPEKQRLDEGLTGSRRTAERCIRLHWVTSLGNWGRKESGSVWRFAVPSRGVLAESTSDGHRHPKVRQRTRAFICITCK